ncbi:MAG TPA: dihydrofolate reductase [Kofleriaceae bacterium]|nr:dihydrofolate reductase [Kofleriaceae bacterium]
MSAFAIVAAVDERMGLARAGDLPWHLPADLAHFKALTSGAPPGHKNAVIMGRATWDSIPARYRPLPRRDNVVITRQPDFQLPEGVVRAGGLDEAVAAARTAAAVFVVGGGQIYRAAIDDDRCAALWLTRIAGDFGCDVWFPPIPDRFALAEVVADSEDAGLRYRIERWVS